THLASLLDEDSVVQDTSASIQSGRFVQPDGSLSHSPVGAVGLWLSDPLTTSLTPGTGILIALPGVRAFGSGAARVMPDAHGEFIDDDGTLQTGPGQSGGPDVTTR